MDNDFYLKITGSAWIGRKLDAGRVLKLKDGEISIYEVAKRDKGDGTQEIYYKGKFTSNIELEQGGETIRGKDKTGQSVKTRYAIRMLAQELDIEDDKTFYEIFHEKLRKNLPFIWEKIKNL